MLITLSHSFFRADFIIEIPMRCISIPTIEVLSLYRTAPYVASSVLNFEHLKLNFDSLSCTESFFVRFVFQKTDLEPGTLSPLVISLW